MSWTNVSFESILDDLSSRFIINIPAEELASVERILFQIEQAHWFYEDFVREQNTSLPSFSLKNFSAKFFQHCPLLAEWASEHETAFANFMEYKFRVPVCGAIILNETMDKCLLVKGWAARSGWGFPKGKINKDELDTLCAAREVWEETGFDITEYIKEEDYVEQTMKDQRVRLYIIKGVSESTVFEPQTRKEISKIEWHKLTDLPTARPKHVDRGPHSGRESGSERPNNNANAKNPSRYYMVIPFVQKLKHWVATQKKMAKRKGSGQANGQRKQENPEIHTTSGAHNHHRHSSGAVVTSTEAKLDSDILKSMLGISIGNKTEPSHQSGSTPTLNHTQISSSSQSSSQPGGTDAQQSSQMLMSLLGIQKASQASPSLQSATPVSRGSQHTQHQQQPQQNGSDAIKAMLGITLGNNTNGSPQLMPANRSNIQHPSQHPHYSPQMGHQQHYLSSPAMANQPHHPPGMGSPMFANGRKSSVDLLSLLNSGSGGGGGGGGGGGNANGGSPLMYRQEAWSQRPGSYSGVPAYQQQQQYPYQQPPQQHQQYTNGPAFDGQKPKQTLPHAPKSNSMQQFQFDLNALV
ncbi:hypothetical protein MVEG_01641 [Podila verticillata NRRL 6337]|nr:hypothetical protein MVEG_01641 [Podila verticillata NRRL 6337]